MSRRDRAMLRRENACAAAEALADRALWEADQTFAESLGIENPYPKVNAGIVSGAYTSGLSAPLTQAQSSLLMNQAIGWNSINASMSRQYNSFDDLLMAPGLAMQQRNRERSLLDPFYGLI